MILIGMGANLPSKLYGSPKQTLTACLDEFKNHGLNVINQSNWYESAPVPVSDQPWYVNGVASIETNLNPRALLEKLLSIEEIFGRVRAELNAPRIIDLDLIAYNDFIEKDENDLSEKPFCVPHPRLDDRAFVLFPIQDIDPDWIHPESNISIADLIDKLPKDQIIRKLD